MARYQLLIQYNIGCVSHVQASVQPYAFTFAIFNSGHPLSEIATNLSTPEGRTARLAGDCPENRTQVARLRIWRLKHYVVSNPRNIA